MIEENNNGSQFGSRKKCRFCQIFVEKVKEVSNFSPNQISNTQTQ